MIFFRSQFPIDSIVSAFRRKGVLFLQDAGMGRIVLSLNISEKDTEDICSIIRNMDIKEFSA